MKAKTVEIGYREDGSIFKVPPTRDVGSSLVSFNLPTAIIWGLIALQVSMSLSGKYSLGWHIVMTVFWRLMYNVGLGFLLHFQSNFKSFTKYYIILTQDPNSWITWLCNFFEKQHMIHVKGYNSAELPPAFKSWILFRIIADIVLVLDVFSYLILVRYCFVFPQKYGLLEISQYVAGFALGVLNFWAKVDAHRCIGDYAWYWGDFFFRVEQHLTFDGVFQLFPHPMYTVGYAWYYALALISRSYTVLFVSMFAHSFQILFLAYVENPHIDRTYGKAQAPSVDEHIQLILYSSKPGQQVPPSPVYFIGLDFFSASDIGLVVTSVYVFLFTYYIRNRFVSVFHVIALKITHWIMLGSILYFQSSSRWWTKEYAKRGKSLYEAFQNWKKLYNFSSSLNLVVFLATSMKFAHFMNKFPHLTAQDVACIFFGIALISVNMWCSSSIYKAIGDFGWFFGDFFAPQSKAFELHIQYTGVYRFMNNPDCVIGYAGYHGLALLTQSWTIFLLALFAQICNIIFVYLVEVPHMKRKYPTDSLREEGPLRSAVKKNLLKGLQVEAEKIRQKAAEDVFEIYSKIFLSQLPKLDSIRLNVPDKVLIGESLNIFFERNADITSPDDWIGLYDVSVSSGPGMSRGAWVHLPSVASGSIEFPQHKLPQNPGVYQVRYHEGQTYKVLAVSRPILFSFGPDDYKSMDRSRSAPSRESKE